MDSAGFLYRLELIIEKFEPSFVKRHINPEVEREKWLSKNIEEISERILWGPAFASSLGNLYIEQKSWFALH